MLNNSWQIDSFWEYCSLWQCDCFFTYNAAINATLSQHILGFFLNILSTYKSSLLPVKLSVSYREVWPKEIRRFSYWATAGLIGWKNPAPNQLCCLCCPNCLQEDPNSVKKQTQYIGFPSSFQLGMFSFVPFPHHKDVNKVATEVGIYYRDSVIWPWSSRG